MSDDTLMDFCLVFRTNQSLLIDEEESLLRKLMIN